MRGRFFFLFKFFFFLGQQACCAPRQLCVLINKPTQGERWPCNTFLSSLSTELSHSSSLFSSPPAPGVAAPTLPPSQLKDRAHPPNPFSGDRGLKEPRRGPPSPAPEPCIGGTPPLKPRRHSDTDKPKGKRPCKTKHTSQREREREKRKEAAPNSPGQLSAADLGAAEDDKVSADMVFGHDTGVWMFAATEAVSVCLSAPLIMQLGKGGRDGGRKYVYNV